MKKIKAGIVGGAGYTGGETIRLLLHHPQVEIAFVQSRSNAGRSLSAVHHDLAGETDLMFTEDVSREVDILFLCLGHGESRKFLEQHPFSKTRIIDLSHDFRYAASLGEVDFVYGLPELNRDKIKQANAVANPGCFATAIQLGLLPLANAGLLHEVFTTGITGSTGAGQKLQNTTQFSWRANNISAYKTLTHQHVKEINQSLHQAQPSWNGKLHFIPWRGDFTRGIFVSSVITSEKSLAELNHLYTNFYEAHPFSIVTWEMIDLKQVVNTNKCLMYLEKEGDKLVVHTAIDNLLKGASGQAVQNMNIMFGMEETLGLKLKAIAF